MFILPLSLSLDPMDWEKAGGPSQRRSRRLNRVAPFLFLADSPVARLGLRLNGSQLPCMKIDLLACFWDHFAKKPHPNFQVIVVKNWGKREFLFHFLGVRDEMKFRKAKNICRLCTSDDLDHFLHTCANEDTTEEMENNPIGSRGDPQWVLNLASRSP